MGPRAQCGEGWSSSVYPPMVVALACQEGTEEAVQWHT